MLEQPRDIEEWLGRVQLIGNVGQTTIAVAELSKAFADRITSLGFDAEGRLHGLDDSLTRHILKHHGTFREYERGQEPISLWEISELYKFMDLGITQLPSEQFQKPGKDRIQTTLEMTGYTWTIIAEVRRKLVVPVTAWKKI